MLLKEARVVCWKKWAAKHECEALKNRECDWGQSKLCGVRRPTMCRPPCDEKASLEGGWVQKRSYDIGRGSCIKENDTEKHSCTNARRRAGYKSWAHFE